MVRSSALNPFARIMSALLVGMALSVLCMPHAFANKAHKKFKGKIIVSEKRFPSRFKTDEAMIKHMKKANTHVVKAEAGKDWEFEYMAFLRKPVGTIQASVMLLDITNPGTETMVDNFTFYPEDKSLKIINGHQRLSRERFQADRKYLMVFARGYGQKPLAKTQIVLRDK